MTYTDSVTLKNTFYYLFLLQLASIVISIAAAQLLYGVVFFLWVYLIAKNREFTFSILDIAFVIFILLRICTILFSEFSSSSSIAFTREIIFYPYYFIALYFVKTFKFEGVQKAIQILVYSSVVVSVYAVISVLTGNISRGASFSGGYYTFSVHLAFVVAFSLALLLSKTNVHYKKIFIVSLVLIIAGIISTYTRSMWVALILCTVILGIIGYRKIVMLAFTIGSMLVFLIPAIRVRVFSIFTPLEHSSGRVELWNIALQYLWVHPFFGFGPETFKDIVTDRSKLFDPGINSWHNEFLQLHIESGIFVAALALFLYGSVVYTIVKLVNKQKSNSEYFMMLFFTFSLCVILPGIITGSVLLSILNGMLLKFVFACSSYIGCEGGFLKEYKFQWR